MTEPLPPLRYFLQPLLAADLSWSAVASRYWPIDDGVDGNATRSVDSGQAWEALANSAAIRALTATLPLFLPATAADLANPQRLCSLPPPYPTFSLPASARTTPATLAACSALRQHGCHCALHVDGAGQIAQLPLAAFDWVQVDAGVARNDLPVLELIRAHDSGLRLMATGVHTRTQFDWLVARHFSLFDGHFVAQPDRQRRRDPDVAKLKLVKLLGLVIDDADTRAIEAVFREEARLSYNLLRLVNSVAVGSRVRIASFRQAIDVLGRRQLRRWLQLLIYANADARANEPNPLLTLAAARGRLMEAICEQLPAPIDIECFAEAAFTVGIFSLLDVLLDQPMPLIVASLPLHASIATALDGRHGVLGELLGALEASEAGEHAAAAATLDRLGVAPSTHLEAQAVALHWASGIVRQQLA